jgi:ABC-type multidrug transport system fused ATPase/permease subunit
MPVPPTQPGDNQAIIMVVTLVAILCVIYWRMALRVVAIILIATTVLGVIASLHGLHHIR